MLDRAFLEDGEATVAIHTVPEHGAIWKPKRTMATSPRLSLFFTYQIVAARGTDKQVRVQPSLRTHAVCMASLYLQRR